MRSEPWNQVFFSQVTLGESFILSQFQLPHLKIGIIILSSKVFVKVKVCIIIESTLILLLPDSQTTLGNSEALLPWALMWNHSVLQESSFHWMPDLETEEMRFNLACSPDRAGGTQQG